MNPLQQLNMADLQQVLLKAMETGGITPLVKEDLEVEAHNQLYEETSETEMTLLKDIARIPAKQIVHQFTVIKGYGNERSRAFIPETGLPTYSKGIYERRTVDIKLIAEYASVTLLAALEATIQARGTSDQTELEMKNKRSLLMHKLNRELYFADPDISLSTLPFRGIFRLLKDYNSIANGLIIDKRGKMLSDNDIRAGAKAVTENHGSMRALYLSPADKTNFENTTDASQRLLLATNVQAQNSLIRGQVIDGILTEGGPCYFRVDNGLTPKHALQLAPDNTDASQFADGVPDPLAVTPTWSDVATASQWLAGDVATDWTWRVTAVNDVGESQYVETTATTPVANHISRITITPRSTDLSFRIYRGSPTKTNGVWGLVGEKKAAGTTAPITWDDTNAVIPNTRCAFGLNVNTNNFRQTRPVELKNPALPGNTLSLVELAPMSVFELAKLFLVASNDIIFQPVAVEVSHPFQNVVYINVGDVANT